MTSIIIPTCDRHQLLVECVRSINKTTKGDVSIVFVDSSRTPNYGIPCNFATHHMSVGSDIGFSKAVNQGAEVALRMYSPDFIVWLNDDCTVYENWLSTMLVAMQSSEKLGIGVFYFSDNRWPGTGTHVFFYRNQVYPNFGCVRTNVWKELKGFNEDYFSYGSETDLGFRCIEKRYLVEPVKGARIHHLYVKDNFRKHHVPKAGEYEDLRIKMYGEESEDNFHWMDEEGVIQTHRAYKQKRD